MNCLNKETFVKTDDYNKIWLNNRCVSGEKYYNSLFSIIIISFPYFLLISIIIPCKIYLPIIFPLIISSFLYISEIISIIFCSCSDAGIIHKQDRDYKYKPNKYYIKKVINGHLYELNYCQTCLLFKPPRASHCQLCDNCILRFDHHCNWIGKCIGQKNYGSFYFLILSLFFSTLFYIIYSLYCIIYQAKNIKNKEKFSKIILGGLSANALYNILLMTFTGRLFITHTYLQLYNKTFYEYLKKKFSYIPGMNPFKKYLLYICKRLVIKCPGKSFYLYFIKQPEKLKLMTLDEMCMKEIEFNYNKHKLSIKSLPKFKYYNISTTKNKENIINNKINNYEINIIKEEEKNNITKEDGDVDFIVNENILNKSYKSIKQINLIFREYK